MNPYCIASAIYNNIANSNAKVEEEEEDADSNPILDYSILNAALKLEKQVRFIEDRKCSPKWRMPFEMVCKLVF